MLDYTTENREGLLARIEEVSDIRWADGTEPSGGQNLDVVRISLMSSSGDLELTWGVGQFRRVCII